MEEALGKLDISEEEGTPLVIDDRDEEGPTKWLLAGKVLYRNQFHVKTMTPFGRHEETLKASSSSQLG